MMMNLNSLDEHALWLAIQVWVGREFISARHLRMRGYEVFLPSYREHRRWSDRVKKIERALFEGYLFCRPDPAAASRIVTSPGVIRIVGDSHGPLPVPRDEIETIQRIVDTGILAEPWPFLQQGQRVRIEAGPLRGAEGVVLTVKNRRRLIVSIAMLQRSVSVDIESDWVSIPHGDIVRAAACCR